MGASFLCAFKVFKHYKSHFVTLHMPLPHLIPYKSQQTAQTLGSPPRGCTGLAGGSNGETAPAAWRAAHGGGCEETPAEVAGQATPALGQAGLVNAGAQPGFPSCRAASPMLGLNSHRRPERSPRPRRTRARGPETRRPGSPGAPARASAPALRPAARAAYLAPTPAPA